MQNGSPSLSSLTSASSLVTKENKGESQGTAKPPSQEGVYATASDGTATESEDILVNAKERIPSAPNRIITAEKMTSPLNASPARSVTDKAMQTVIE